MRFNPDKCMFGVEGGKFLDYMLTHRGIEANPKKCRAITEMRSPENVKEIQKLISRLTTLSRFLPKLVEKTKSIIQLLRKATKFNWMVECEEIFLHLKASLVAPSVIQKSDTQRSIIIYLAVLEEAVSATLVQEVEKEEQLVYFISGFLHVVEVSYKMIEKVAITLLVTARRMRIYFQNHHIIVKTDYPIMKILAKHDLVGRMIRRVVELYEFQIQYQPRGVIKSLALADFTTKLSP